MTKRSINPAFTRTRTSTSRLNTPPPPAEGTTPSRTSPGTGTTMIRVESMAKGSPTITVTPAEFEELQRRVSVYVEEVSALAARDPKLTTLERRDPIMERCQEGLDLRLCNAFARIAQQRFAAR